VDILAEPAEFSCCSSGVVCFTSYRQCAESDIFEARNSKDINWFIVFNLNTYYRQEDCALLGYYAESSVSLIPTFRNKQSLSSSRVFLTHSDCFRRFGTNYRSHLQVILTFSSNILLMIREKLLVNFMCILDISGNLFPTFRNKAICPIFKGVCCPEWYFITDVSGQRIGPIFKGF